MRLLVLCSLLLLSACVSPPPIIENRAELESQTDGLARWLTFQLGPHATGEGVGLHVGRSSVGRELLIIPAHILPNAAFATFHDPGFAHIHFNVNVDGDETLFEVLACGRVAPIKSIGGVEESEAVRASMDSDWAVIALQEGFELSPSLPVELSTDRVVEAGDPLLLIRPRRSPNGEVLVTQCAVDPRASSPASLIAMDSEPSVTDGDSGSPVMLLGTRTVIGYYVATYTHPFARSQHYIRRIAPEVLACVQEQMAE